MKKIFNTSLIIVISALALLLAGCENEDYAAMSCSPSNLTGDTINCALAIEPPAQNTTDKEYQNKGGVTGQVLSRTYWSQAQVCFDINRNGQCDPSSEPVEQTFSQGRFSFANTAIVQESIADKVPLLAINQHADTDLIALYAPSPEIASYDEDKPANITLFTTLVANEIRYNPYHINKLVSAQQSLALDIATIETLEGRDYITNEDAEISAQSERLFTSLRQGQQLAIHNHYLATAAVVDKIYQENSLDTMITAQDILKQNELTAVFSGDLSSTSVDWELAHEDEISVDIHSVDNLAVIGSKYHNRLTVVDISTVVPQWISSHFFADSPVERHQIDAMTGATEQVLSHVTMTPDKNSVIVAIEKYVKDSENIGVGVYRAHLSDPYSIPNQRFAAAEVNTNYFPSAKLKDITLSNDGLTLALVGDDRKLTLLNSDDFSVKSQINVKDKARSVSLNSTNNMAYVGLLGNPKGVAIIDLASEENIAFIDTQAHYPDKLVAFPQSNKLVVHTYQSNMLNIFDTNTPSVPKLLMTLAATDKIKHFALSSNEKMILVALLGGRLELYNIENNVRLIKAFTTEKNNQGVNKTIKSITFSSDNKALINIENALQTLSIIERTVTQWTEKEKQEWFENHRS